MNNLTDEAKDGMPVMVTVRPEEFVPAQDENALRVKVLTSTFLGQSIQYEIAFEEGLQADDIHKGELTDSIKYASRICCPGDEILLCPMADKINVFTQDGSRSLIQEG